MERLTARSQRVGPKVHKNLRLEKKWGTKYHKAIQEIVFGKQHLPYMPTEPPASLSEEIVESDPLYVCRHCRDCFRFQSSFEDHNTRRSWILGLWCYACFETVCTHLTEAGSTCIQCLQCMKKSNEKRIYLRERGLRRGQKLGVVKVFYNQCQFIEHLKMHHLSTVNLGDLMLMPLPIGMSANDWCSEVEIICEALMERTFLIRTHIIDWLKTYDLQDDWWKLANGKSSNRIINKAVNGYQGRELFKTYEKPMADKFMNFNPDLYIIKPDIIYEKARKNFGTQSNMNNNSKDENDINNCSTNVISDKDVVEDEDNPCTPNDITFVDCGPTSQCFEPEIPMNYRLKNQSVLKKLSQEIEDCRLANVVRMNNETKSESFKDHNSLEIDIIHENITINNDDNGSNKNFVCVKQSRKDSVQQCKLTQPFINKVTENNLSKSTAKIGINKMVDNSIKISIPFSANKNTIINTSSEQSLQTSMTSNSKILTIQGPNNIASIISQISPHFISNKKIVVIEQDSGNIITCNKNELTTKKDVNNLIVEDDNIDFNISTQKNDFNIKKQEVTGKIVMKDGKKYLIKRTKNITKNPKNSSNLSIVKNTIKTPEQLISESNTNTSTSRVTLNNSNETENIGIEQAVFSHNNMSVLRPSPSTFKLSSSSSCESNVKKTLAMPKLQKVPPHLISISSIKPQKNAFETISLIKEDNGNLYMDIKVMHRVVKDSFIRSNYKRDMCDIVIKGRREMFDELYQLNSLELKKRLEHLEYVNTEMRQVLNFMSDTVFQEKIRSFNTIKCILEECILKHNQDVQDTKDDDVMLNEWEMKMDSIYKCSSCDKLMKPKSYIPGFSKLPKYDNAYCSCYKQVCHQCLSYQGTTSRFIAHQNFHRKDEPYVCPDCEKKFESAKSLEIHTWSVCFHTLKRIVFACKICEIDGFRDMESVTRHFVAMHSIIKIGCEDCSRVFSSYSEYTKHCTEAHSSKVEQNPIRLVICKISNVTLRCEKYMSYLEKYPIIRKLVWFKCPFCQLITTEHKHITMLLNNHLRSNHLDCLSRTLSKEIFIEIFGIERRKTNVDTISKNHADKVATQLPSADGTIVPKIVNTRTISSEIFERGSQDTEHTWSTNSDGINNVSLQTTEKIGDKDKTELLPKIIKVRSINELKLLNPKESITKFSTETKKKSNFPSLQAIETNDGKMDLCAREQTGLDNNKSDSKEETAKTKEFGKSNKELTINTSCISESSLMDTVDVIRVDSSTKSSKETSNSASGTNGRIKIVDFRKICKPDLKFMIDETCDTEMKDESTNNLASIPKPPPLTRIPQHLLTSMKIYPLNNKSEVSQKPKSKRSVVRRVVNKSKERIALGTDTQKEESVDYLCHLCDERINSSQSVVQAHFREKHSNEYKLAIITPRLSRISHDFINGGYKQLISNKKRKLDSSVFVSKRKRRWTPKKHVEIKETNAPTGLCIEQETAEDGEGNFICKKCDQRCTNMSDLREHIATNHRLKGRYLICLECGENFVVAPSLQMHLKAFHGIEDPISYMSQNPSYAPDVDSDSPTGGKTTVANQCHVCMAVFEDKAAVDKHLRVHGMAFLNRKRIEARNALEKKTNTEDDKPSIIKDNPKEAVKQDKPAETILEKINAAI
ncbi:hypothetical protein P5V15_001788 [Pogonomyrmex californicus]